MRRLFGWFQSRRARSILALFCLALILVSANIVAARFLPKRLDLTAEHLYTLSRGTRLTLTHIDEPITLRFYYSTRLGGTIPAYAVYAQRVRELLDQYVAEAGGKIRLEIYDPQPFSDVEDRAVAFGLQGVPLNNQGEQVYFGLAGTNSTDDEQTVAFFAPERERFLEYDLTRLVHTLAYPKRTVVSVISSLPLDGDPMAMLQGRPKQAMAFLDQLRQSDDIEMLAPDAAAIPPGTDVLMLVHPQNLPPKTLFAIDQFVLRGGKAIVFVDPYSELQARGGEPPGKPADSNLEPLFTAWGVKLVPNTIAADRKDARRVVVPTAGGAGAGQAMDYIAWINLRGGDLNHDDVITANLRQVTMASAGILEPVTGAQTNLTPLISTSPESMKLPVEKVTGLPDVAGLLTHFKSDGNRYVLAARITGPADTAFPDGLPKEAEAAAHPHPNPPPPAGEGTGSPPPQAGEGGVGVTATAPSADFLKKSAKPLNLVVVADSDMLDERFWAQSENFFGRREIVPVANNADFVANAIDVLAGGEDLVDLRSRGTSARPFELVEQIQQAADDRYASEQQELQQKLKQTQGKLRELTAGEGANANAPLTPEQAQTVDQFRADLLITRRELRGVQSALRRDIESLKTILEFIDIALVPIIVAAAAIVLGALRLRRRRRRTAPA